MWEELFGPYERERFFIDFHWFSLVFQCVSLVFIGFSLFFIGFSLLFIVFSMFLTAHQTNFTTNSLLNVYHVERISPRAPQTFCLLDPD